MIQEVTKRPLHECLLYLAFVADKNKAEVESARQTIKKYEQ